MCTVAASALGRQWGRAAQRVLHSTTVGVTFRDVGLYPPPGSPVAWLATSVLGARCVIGGSESPAERGAVRPWYSKVLSGLRGEAKARQEVSRGEARRDGASRAVPCRASEALAARAPSAPAAIPSATRRVASWSQRVRPWRDGLVPWGGGRGGPRRRATVAVWAARGLGGAASIRADAAAAALLLLLRRLVCQSCCCRCAGWRQQRRGRGGRRELGVAGVHRESSGSSGAVGAVGLGAVRPLGRRGRRLPLFPENATRVGLASVGVVRALPLIRPAVGR